MNDDKERKRGDAAKSDLDLESTSSERQHQRQEWLQEQDVRREQSDHDFQVGLNRASANKARDDESQSVTKAKEK